MGTLTHDDFEKPSPGTWMWDASHQSRPHPLLLQGPVVRGMDAGFREGFERVGALVEVIESRYVHGWIYQAVRPVGAPPEPKGTPPKLVFKLLTMLHPEIRRRIRRAKTTWTERPWRKAAEWWQGVEVEHRAALHALAERYEGATTTEEFRAGLRDAAQLVEHTLRDHMIESIPSNIAVGDLFVFAERHGIPVRRTVRVLAGSSPETTRPTEQMLAVLDALRAAGDLEILDGDVSDVVEQLREHPDAGPPFRAHFDEYAYRALDMHIDVAETLVERPDVIVHTLRGLRGHTPTFRENIGLAVAREIRDELPADVRTQWDEAVREARTAAENRETSAGLGAWACGLLRLFAVELGSRLHALPSPHAIFHVALEELDALPDAAELERRMESHEASAAVTPPSLLGTPGEPPPPEWLPPEVARLERAVQAYVSRFNAAPDLEESEQLQGLGVSSGTVSGQVFVLEDHRELDAVPPGCILVTHSTNPTLNPVLPLIGGLVTEVGGLICHSAIMARELGFPGVVGCANAMVELEHGSWVELDGESGTIRSLDGPVDTKTAASDAFTPVDFSPELPRKPGRWVALKNAGDTDRFGGKAARLAVAVDAGHRVPNGVALDVDFVEAVAAGDPDHRAQLAEVLEGLSGLLAVRSSSPQEDGTSASFAGIHHTGLGVKSEVDAVVEAIAEVWASGVSPAAQAYRARLGIEGRPRMGVIVQELLPADASGVRFGRDPVSGDDVRIVECAPGLGALVVDGAVIPDRVRLDRTGKILERAAGGATKKLVPDVGGGVKEVAVSDEEREKSPIHNGLLSSVHNLGEACDALFEGPQDVEWAAVDGQVWLLQSRPVTTGGAS